MEVGKEWAAAAGYRDDRVVSVVMTLHRLIHSLKNPGEAEVSLSRCAQLCEGDVGEIVLS